MDSHHMTGRGDHVHRRAEHNHVIMSSMQIMHKQRHTSILKLACQPLAKHEAALKHECLAWVVGNLRIIVELE
jgi:hypothetical protein